MPPAQAELFAEAPDPLRFPCTYLGNRYDLPCRAKAGEPCRWPRFVPSPPFHAERRVAAGERLKSYEELVGDEARAEEPPGGDDDDQAEAAEDDL